MLLDLDVCRPVIHPGNEKKKGGPVVIVTSAGRHSDGWDELITRMMEMMELHRRTLNACFDLCGEREVKRKVKGKVIRGARGKGMGLGAAPLFVLG